MKIPSSSSMILAGLAISSSSPSLAAPTGDSHGEGSISSSSSNRAISSRRESVSFARSEARCKLSYSLLPLHPVLTYGPVATDLANRDLDLLGGLLGPILKALDPVLAPLKPVLCPVLTGLPIPDLLNCNAPPTAASESVEQPSFTEENIAAFRDALTAAYAAQDVSSTDPDTSSDPSSASDGSSPSDTMTSASPEGTMSPSTTNSMVPPNTPDVSSASSSDMPSDTGTPDRRRLPVNPFGHHHRRGVAARQLPVAVPAAIPSLPVSPPINPSQVIGAAPIQPTQIIGTVPVKPPVDPNQIPGSLPVDPSQIPGSLPAALPVAVPVVGGGAPPSRRRAPVRAPVQASGQLPIPVSSQQAPAPSARSWFSRRQVPSVLPVAPPALPITPPALPVAPPALPVSPPGLPVTPSALPVTPPALPVTPPGLPVTAPVLPVAPVAPAGAPHTPVARQVEGDSGEDGGDCDDEQD